MKTVTRRNFLKAAAGSTLYSVSPARAVGANNRINVAFIGVGSMGLGHVGTCAQMEDINIVAVCDVDSSHQSRAKAIAGSKAVGYTDFRRILDSKDVDAIVVATPEHWHPYITVRAFEAGKDVYTEKPLGHNIHEGSVVVKAASAHKRVCQVGLQQRSGSHWQHAVERIRSGELGRITSIHAWNAWRPDEMRGRFGHPPNSDPPPGVDYDLWLGPAPARPFNPARFHLYWCYFWDYSGGMVSGWGVHLFDIAQWAMGEHIESVSAIGGKFVLDDARETPDTFEAMFRFPTHLLSYSLRHGNAWRPHGDLDHGIEFFGENATIQINRRGFQLFKDDDRNSRNAYYSENAEGNDYANHLADFFNAVRTRNQPSCPAEAGHQASTYGHLANVAYRTGTTVRWNHEADSISGDGPALELMSRQYREPWKL